MRLLLLVPFLLIFSSSNLLFSQTASRIDKNNFHSFPTVERSITEELKKLTPAEFYDHPEFGVIPFNAGCDSCFELLHKRTANSRYFVEEGSGGDAFFIQQFNGRAHYELENGDLKTLDYRLSPKSENIYRAENQDLPTEIDLNTGYSTITLADGTNFSFNKHLKLKYIYPDNTTNECAIDRSQTTVGSDGARTLDAWPSIHSEQIFKRGEIKTSFYIQEKSAVDFTADWLVVEDKITLPQDYKLEFEAGAYPTPEGLFQADIDLKDANGKLLATLKKPVVLDQEREMGADYHQTATAYELEKVGDDYFLRVYVSVDWLAEPSRVFPVVIDPIFSGYSEYPYDIGYTYNPVCSTNPPNSCPYNMDVTVPGMTELKSLQFELIYNSSVTGCGGACFMNDVRIRFEGPCGSATGWCDSIVDTPGTCTIYSVTVFSMISCLPPSCDDHVIPFGIRTSHCSCTTPNCDFIQCHSTLAGDWWITVYGGTVSENPIFSPSHPDFTICQGDTILLSATADCGVPPYEYHWSPVGVVGDPIPAWPDTSTVFTSIVFDDCGNSDTVEQLVTVLPAPMLSLGPFEDCYSVTMDAGPDWDSYLWSPGGETTQSITVDSSGIYSVTVTDGNGCPGTSDPINVTIHEPPLVDAQPDTVFVTEGALAPMSVTSNEPSAIFSWMPPENVSCEDCPETNAITDHDMTFYVTAEANGCPGGPDSVVVIVTQTEFDMPNAFTPNADGVNDVFRVVNPILYPNFQLQVFNRWGEALFATDDINEGWDGTFNGKPQEVGSYIWLITYNKGIANPEFVVMKGTVTLVR